MTSIKVNFEIGHKASLRSKKTPEGFTHDWEVFVRGLEGADISHFVDKVVFHLHETFPKPDRVVKELPFSVKESGYAGFILPIDIYLKNKNEPKKIHFSYDFNLQQSGILKDRYVFHNPNDDFKKKLLRGGGLLVTNNAYYTNPDQESRSRDSFSEEKQLVSKPKLSSDNVKKHKSKEHKEEVPLRTSSFENLFGPPIQKPPKISPDLKKTEKSNPKSDKKDRERSSSEKKSKHNDNDEVKEKKPKKDKEKKVEKLKSQNKEPEKSKDKQSKRPSETLISPVASKKRCESPVKRPPSPPVRSSSASSMKEDYRPQKQVEVEKKSKQEEKPPEQRPEKEGKEKKKKEKKSHDRDKERKEKKEHKKENQRIKESPVVVNKEIQKEVPKEIPKVRDPPPKERENKEPPPVKEKSKPDKPINKISIENFQKTPTHEEDKVNQHKKDKSDSDKKHKHKKKDKKRDESREKHKESNKEKKHKHDKNREVPVEKPEVIEHRETPVPKERPPLELASPISIDTASQCSSKSGLAKISHINDDINSSHSDSEGSIVGEDDDKSKHLNPSPDPEPPKHDSPDPELDIEEPELPIEPELEPIVEEPVAPKEKSKKHKEKSKKEDKKRKRKAEEEEDSENRKIAKLAENPLTFNEPERGESSGSMATETKVQDNGVSSSLGEDAEPGDISPDYMVQLRDLQQRIMKIKNNEDLERVVNLIAETGRYEITTQTFDFDLCSLDRSTVQQLIQLVGC